MKPSAFDALPKAKRARVAGSRVVIQLTDGRDISFPWAHNTKLAQASPAARRRIQLICEGTGLHWPELDEDLSVRGVLEGRLGATPSAR